MNKTQIFVDKVYRKIHFWIFDILGVKNTFLRFYLYPSYWHMVLRKQTSEGDKRGVYLTQCPNKGAGIGHQLANWNSGLWYSSLFETHYAYSELSSESWNEFFGFFKNEIAARELLESGYKKRCLPYFDSDNPKEVIIVRNIIESYMGYKVVFFLDLDQGYRAQCGTKSILRDKFNSAYSRVSDNLFYDSAYINIAVHIRRGDIGGERAQLNQRLKARWLDNNYYANIIEQISYKINNNFKVKIYLFSQGDKKEFTMFDRYDNLVYCLDCSAMESFLHMVRADILVMSRSSFSYKPALISDGIIICPPGFWHEYPEDERWMMVDGDGLLCKDQLDSINRMLLYNKQKERA